MEQQYLDLLSKTLYQGIKTPNRTGIDTYMIPGASLTFDCSTYFPAPTTKKLAWKAVKGELIAFLRGNTSAADFRDLDCKIWDINANDPGTRKNPNVWLSNPHRKGRDDLGKIYGAQWRNFDGHKSTNINIQGTDQIENLLHSIVNTPTSRRQIVSAWNPNQLDQMALPPCHLMFQVITNPDTKHMHMLMYQRSCDMFLGVPFNIASYALLLNILAHWTGYIPSTLTMFLADVHVYENHVTQVQEQLSRTPSPLQPRLHIYQTVPTYADVPKHYSHKPAQWLIDTLDPATFELLDYSPQAAITAPMAV